MSLRSRPSRRTGNLESADLLLQEMAELPQARVLLVDGEIHHLIWIKYSFAQIIWTINTYLINYGLSRVCCVSELFRDLPGKLHPLAGHVFRILQA
jgi:hypothetical protein